MKLKSRVNPSSAAALHTSPVEGTQASFASDTHKFLFHMAVLYWSIKNNKRVNFEQSSLKRRKKGLWFLNLTGFHPFHWFNKYRGAISWFVLPSPWTTISLTPLEARFTFSSFVGDYTLLRGNNSTTLLTPIHSLRI